MPTLASFLIGLIPAVIAKIFLALGFQVVTYVGLQAIFEQLAQMASQQYGAIPAEILGLLALSGVPEALSMITGAYATRVSIIHALHFVSKFEAVPKT